MKSFKAPKILFFSAGRVPSPSEMLEALELGTPVQWRNKQAHTEGSIEPCDGIAGDMPDEYKRLNIKPAKEAVEAYKNTLTAAMKGDVKAPSTETTKVDNPDKTKLLNGGTWGQ